MGVELTLFLMADALCRMVFLSQKCNLELLRVSASSNLTLCTSELGDSFDSYEEE